jgi:hypothetical protein
MRWLLGIVLLALALGMTACGGDKGGNDGSSGSSDAVAAVQAITDYWNARVEMNEEALYQSTCAARESLVPALIQSLASVQNLRLEDFACHQTGSSGDDLIVTCDGKLVADYGAGDVNEFPLRSYLMTKENDKWKMCGEADAPEGSS